MVMVRMRTGFAVMGDTQQLPGYSLLLTDDPSADHLSDLPWPKRSEFLDELALLGGAVERVCRPRGLRRINYEVLGNSLSFLHGHVHARYEWEPADLRGGPVWSYPREARDDPAHAYSDARHGQLRVAITCELQRLMKNRAA
jgi:diadenosine tetraphosphate (Ap4A) HIT family hydrolase